MVMVLEMIFLNKIINIVAMISIYHLNVAQGWHTKLHPAHLIWVASHLVVWNKIKEDTPVINDWGWKLPGNCKSACHWLCISHCLLSLYFYLYFHLCFVLQCIPKKWLIECWWSYGIQLNHQWLAPLEPGKRFFVVSDQDMIKHSQVRFRSKI